jgi:hypothetical protein
LVDNTLYKQLVGILLYLTHSRPDLSYVVGAVSRFMQEPHELHWKVAKCILRYVHGTITFGIHYAATLHYISSGLLILTGLAIALITSPHLVTHSVLVPGLSVGRERSKLAISLSSAEAEYRGVVNITIQAMWLQHFLTELGIQFHQDDRHLV